MDRIELKELTRSYLDKRGERFLALDHVSLLWEKGNSMAVMGESGSGKSTLARLMLGLEKPSEGAVFIDGEDTRRWGFSRWRRQRTEIQGVFQDAGDTLNPAWSTFRNVEEALYNCTNWTAKERKRKIAGLMETVGLSRELLNIPVHSLSGGEQRRLALLRSLSVSPAFLILDEVTAGLDVNSTEMVLQLLERYQREYGCAYFVITHDMQTAARLCGTLYEIEHGRLVRRAVRS